MAITWKRIYLEGGTDVAIADGGTGQSTSQLAINALSAVSAATNEHVLTKDTATGNAIFKVSAGQPMYWQVLSTESVAIAARTQWPIFSTLDNQGIVTLGAGTELIIHADTVAAVTDHGNLTGTGDDDHTQYVLVAGTRAFTGAQSMGSQRLTTLAAPTTNGDAVRATTKITEALLESATDLKHTQGSDTALGAVGTKNPPIDADLVIYRDSTALNVLVTSTWTQIKAFLKTYEEILEPATTTLAASDCQDKIINNYGQTADAVLTLPTAAAEMSFSVILGTTVANYFRLDPAAGDSIYLNGATTGDGKYVGIASAVVGAVISFVSFKTGASAWDWYASTVFGNWIAEA